ncbi:protein usg [Sphingomonas arenae]|uniref:protein usg n=1 Tax=Sphingomonas arenae TaxID=2812555 RepID=UPI00196826FB|nr:protein usg [Sphingomonas arenae]
MTQRLVTREFELQLEGYGLSLVEVHYFMPDHPSLLQQFSFQQYDVAPRYPALHHFLDHWRREIEATIQSIRLAHQQLIGPNEWRTVDREWLIN